MSGLETLPPDQRAVLQLILAQGRGYADLAATLRLDVDAVRSRAHAGVEALAGPAAGGHELAPGQRARIADYLLGQQDEGERIVTYAELGDSAPACRWAQELRARLAGIARDELPEVPAAAKPSANGHAPAAPKPPAAAAHDDDRRSDPLTGGQDVVQPPPPAPRDADAPSQPPSRLGGALLLAGVAAVLVVLAILLIGGGDDDSGSPATSAQTQTQTQPSSPRTTATTTQPTPRLVAQVNLDATATGGQAIGIGVVQRAGSVLGIAIEAQRLPANGAQDIYAVWLQGAAGNRFLGFVPRQVREGGTFTVSAELPRNVRDYSSVLVTRESTAATPTTPGEQILTGALRLPA